MRPAGAALPVMLIGPYAYKFPPSKIVMAAPESQTAVLEQPEPLSTEAIIVIPPPDVGAVLPKVVGLFNAYIFPVQ